MKHFLFYVNCYLKTANRKQQNSKQKTTKQRQLSLIGCQLRYHVANCDIMFKSLHKINPFEPIRDPGNCDVRVIFFCEGFSLGHVIITTIIMYFGILTKILIMSCKPKKKRFRQHFSCY